MDPKEISKHKVNVMKSIFANKKLARTFTDALNSPLGSTKRDNARSTLSIIGKLGGANGQGGPGYYGQGGPGDGALSGFSPVSPSLYSPSYSNDNHPGYKEDYGNMMIFPAAPKFKVSGGYPSGLKKGQGGPGYGMGGPGDFPSSFSDINIIAPYTPPPVQPSDPSQSQPTTSSPITSSGSNVATSVYGNANSYQPITQTPQSWPWLNSALGAVGQGLQNTWDVFSGSGVRDPLNPNAYLPGPNAPMSFSGMNRVGGTTSPTGNIANPSSLWGNLASTTPSGSQGPNIAPAKTGTNLIADTSGISGSSSTGNIASTTIASLLNVQTTTPLSQIPVKSLADAIVKNENNAASSTAIQANNNPGNLKFEGQAGAVQGSPASDGGYYAKFNTSQDGYQALLNDLQSKYSSGKYSTLNDLMSVYSPNSGAPGSTSGSTDSQKNPGTPDYSTATGIMGAAQDAVKAHEGAGYFALNATNSTFGGSLQSLIDKTNTDLKNQFGLTQLEDQLTKLKNEKGNIIPTLQQYISGKDQYLKFIDQMIANVDTSSAHADMSDPLVANSISNYRTYLVTLQGRQNQRYGNFLNSAIADYNTDVQNAQNNYDNVYKRYTDALTSQTNIETTDYNNLFQAMGSLYNELDQAPTKLANLNILQQQAYAAQLQSMQNAYQLQYGSPVFKDMTQFDPIILDTATDPATGKTTKILRPSGEVDLASMYKVAAQSHLESGLTTMVTSGMLTGIDNPSSSGAGLKVAADYKKMLVGLAADPTYGPLYTPGLATAFQKGVSGVLPKYVTGDITNIRAAIQELVGSSGGFLGFGKAQGAGLKDRNAWVSKYTAAGVQADVLNAIYDGVQSTFTDSSGKQTAYAKNPVLIFTTPAGNTTGDLSKTSDTDMANIVSNIVTGQWINEIANSIPKTQ